MFTTSARCSAGAVALLRADFEFGTYETIPKQKIDQLTTAQAAREFLSFVLRPWFSTAHVVPCLSRKIAPSCLCNFSYMSCADALKLVEYSMVLCVSNEAF